VELQLLEVHTAATGTGTPLCRAGTARLRNSAAQANNFTPQEDAPSHESPSDANEERTAVLEHQGAGYPSGAVEALSGAAPTGGTTI